MSIEYLRGLLQNMGITIGKDGTVTISKLSTGHTTLGAATIRAGQSGIAGNVKVYPATANKGYFEIDCADQTGDTRALLQVAAMAAARTITLDDPGAAANIVLAPAKCLLTQAAQEYNGVAKSIQVRAMKFTETGHGTYTGSVTVPAGYTLVKVRVVPVVAWGAGTAAAMNVGDNGSGTAFFNAVNLKTLSSETVVAVAEDYASADAVTAVVTATGSDDTAGRTLVLVEMMKTTDITAATKA